MAEKSINLAEKPELVVLLDKYGLLPTCKKGGRFEGCARKWAQEGKAPYDNPKFQALAERLPTGWEELTRDELDKLIERLNVTIEEKKKAPLDVPNQGNRAMLKSLTRMAFLATTTVASLLANTGVGRMPDREEGEKERAQQFSFDMMLHLVIGSKLLDTIFENIAKTANTNEKNREIIADILKLIAILMGVLAASKGDEDKLKSLLDSFSVEISKSFDKVENFVSEGVIAETINKETGKGIALYLNQARLAIKKDDFDGFFAAYNGALGLLGITHDLLVGDLKEIEKFASMLSEALTTSQSDETITAMSRAL